MITLLLKFPNGQMNEIRVDKIVSIDGIPFQEVKQPDVGNQEDRIRNLELIVGNVCKLLDEKFPPPSSQEEPVVEGLSS